MREAFRRISELKSLARAQTLVVLVWGPGDPGPGGTDISKKYWLKRNQIRSELQNRFPNSEIYFSESDTLRRATEGLGDLLNEELVHAKIANCIIVLDTSRGTNVEVDRFSSIPSIAEKMTILLPDQYVGNTGLVSHIHNKLRVQGFSNNELEKCTVATVKSVSIVESIALGKLIADSG